MTRRLRAALAVLVLALPAALSCGDGQRTYDNNDLQLLTRYAAKELCSCVFVMGQSDDFCGRWTKASPDLKTFRIDHGDRSVETQAVLFWGARARFVSPRAGCVLE